MPRVLQRPGALLPSLLILWLFGSLSAISVGTQAFVGRRFAEKRDADAGAIRTNSALFAFVAGLIFSVIGYLDAVPPRGPHQGPRPSRRRPRLPQVALPRRVTSMTTTFAFKAFFDGIGKTYVHLVSAIVMNMINIALCLIFIFGNATLGAPKMGIAGAGLAGFVSTYVGLAILAGFALHPTSPPPLPPLLCEEALSRPHPRQSSSSPLSERHRHRRRHRWPRPLRRHLSAARRALPCRRRLSPLPRRRR
ncbi:MAG: hypothetical protein R3B70_14325 [Polyangiaceae bacterium]